MRLIEHVSLHRVLRASRRLFAAGSNLAGDLAFVARTLRGDGPSPVLRSGARPRPSAGTPAPPPERRRDDARVPATPPVRDGVELVAGGPSDVLAQARPGARLTIRVGGREEIVAVDGRRAILDAALAAGLPMPSSCRAGGCGACKVRLVAGRVALPAGHCLDAAELAAGDILTCVGCALTDVTLEVPA